MNLLPRVALGERYKPSHAVNEAKTGRIMLYAHLMHAGALR